MSVGVAFLVKDPPIGPLTALVDYLHTQGVSEFVFSIDDRTEENTVKAIQSWPGAKWRLIKWDDDFSAARNAVLGDVSSDFTLILDPDELPTPRMMEHVRNVTSGGLTGAMAWLYWTKNYWHGLLGPSEEYHWHCRLFRTGHGRFYNRVHELVMIDGQPESRTRNSPAMPKAPKEAYLIHSKWDTTNDAMYNKLGGYIK